MEKGRLMRIGKLANWVRVAGSDFCEGLSEMLSNYFRTSMSAQGDLIF